MKSYLIKLLLSIILSWIYEKGVKPVEDIFYNFIADEGYFLYEECKKRSYSTLCRDIKKAREILVICKNDLPTTDETLIYCHKWRHIMAIPLMHYGSYYLHDKSKKAFSFLDRERYFYEKSIIERNLKIYDLVDDLHRDHVCLYEKRIKLFKIKELLNLDNYLNIELPHIVPPEFIPDWRQP